ncbi:hypothetical protein PM082_022795 [Marasmius tenuissimus]|nr:hypothetical protein PM082_022795 [Marasmius tenuissimus]
MRTGSNPQHSKDDFLPVMNAKLAASCLGFVMTAADWCLCWKDEKRIIWRLPLKITAANVLYIGTNYSSFFIHAADVAITFFSRIKHPYGVVPYNVCMVHFVFMSIVASVLCALLHLILMLRVYALYGKNRYMGVFLSLALIGRTAALLGIFSVYDYTPEYKNPFGRECALTIHLHANVMIFVIIELALHAVWCGLTLLKTWSLREYPTQNFSPVLNRDALLVWGAVLGVFVVVLAGTHKTRLADIVSICVFPLLVSVTCRSGCRVVIHLQRLSETEGSEKESEDLVFSTVDSTWDTHTRPL